MISYMLAKVGFSSSRWYHYTSAL